MTVPIELDELESDFKAAVLEKVPAAKFDLCMTCGTCTGGCPASELMDMDPRKLLRMVNLGMDEEVKNPNGPGCAPCAPAASTPAP
jgi:heterodisulfide reductase subunit C